MYKELTIENIKTFEKEQKLKIAPITLIYGENSSGKTTLLKIFDIVHNIFAEYQVKSGKNVSEKKDISFCFIFFLDIIILYNQIYII